LEDRDNEETRRQMQEQHPILQKQDFNGEDNHKEENNEFEKDQLEGEEGFEGSKFGFSDSDDVVGETQYNEMETRGFWQSQTPSSKSLTCIGS